MPCDETPIDLRRYRCPSCGGVFQVLPGFLARNLWRTWATVEASCVVAPVRRLRRVVALRTQRRWRARMLLLVLGALRLAAVTEMVGRIGLDATRGALLTAFLPLAGALGSCASLAILLNRARPGLRVM